MKVMHAQYKDMIALRKENWSLQAIGEKYGVSRERVRQIIGNTGQVLPKAKRNAVKDKLPMIKQMWKNGVSFLKIGKEIGINSSLVAKVLGKPSSYGTVFKHGTRSGYGYHKCRCDACKKAQLDYMSNRNHDLRKKGLCIRCRKPSQTWVCSSCR